jgi:putative DNA primase/helicase
MSSDLYAPDKGAVLKAADGRWQGIFQALASGLVHAQSRPGKAMACPVHGGKDGFRVFKKTAGTSSGGVCQSCGIKADGFALIQWVNDWDFHQTLQQVGSLLGIEDPNGRSGIGAIQPKRIVKSQTNAKGPSDKWIVDWLRKTWEESVELTDPSAEPARLYLRARGILCWDREGLDKAVRFHPRLTYQHDSGLKESLPAIVALVKKPSGKGITLHRIYLTCKGEKAYGEESKKMFAIPSDRTLVGGCIQTSPGGEEVDICEGLETGLAIETAIGVPVWPMVNAYLLEHFEPRPGTKRVFVWADKDRSQAGQDAAVKLRARLKEKGIAVHILLPRAEIPAHSKGIDRNDILVTEGKKAFERRLSSLRVA